MEKEFTKMKIGKWYNRWFYKLVWKTFYKSFYYHTFDYFEKQSGNYPYYWKNYRWWGSDNNKQNPIYEKLSTERK